MTNQCIEAIRARIAEQEPKKVIVLRGQRDKVVAIYRENDEEIIRAEMTKAELLKVWEKEDD